MFWEYFFSIIQILIHILNNLFPAYLNKYSECEIKVFLTRLQYSQRTYSHGFLHTSNNWQWKLWKEFQMNRIIFRGVKHFVLHSYSSHFYILPPCLGPGLAFTLFLLVLFEFGPFFLCIILIRVLDAAKYCITLFFKHFFSEIVLGSGHASIFSAAIIFDLIRFVIPSSESLFNIGIFSCGWNKH